MLIKCGATALDCAKWHAALLTIAFRLSELMSRMLKRPNGSKYDHADSFDLMDTLKEMQKFPTLGVYFGL